MSKNLSGGGGGKQPLLALEDVTVRVRDRKLLAHTSWTIREGEQWAVLGPNGSGKSSLVRTIAGELPSAAGRILKPHDHSVALVSFEAQAALYAREVENDLARHFSGRPDELLTTRDLIHSGIRSAAPPEAQTDTAPAKARLPGEGTAPALTSLLDTLEIEHLLDRPFRHLSAGEMRKALIARALASHPSLLILDEPFDGLDMASRQTLMRYLDRLMAEGRHVILVTHRAEEIHEAVSHVLMLKEGNIAGIGRRKEMLQPARLEELYGTLPAGRAEDASRGARPSSVGTRRAAAPARPTEGGETLVEMVRVTVRYDDTVVIRDLDWRLRAGERWGLFGPNGSGKTTLLNLIVGDNLQAYANDIRIFGRKRGSGESVWEIKKHIGLVTPHLQLGYRHSVTGLEAVLSGLFDSIGLYRRPTDEETQRAESWLDALGIRELSDRHFTRLSYGQRRLLLIARAMVKGPRLLVLDEPCQGLDPANRERVLEAIDAACTTGETSLLYVSHHEDEHPACLTHSLTLTGPGQPVETAVLG